jgi:hypothetical protein
MPLMDSLHVAIALAPLATYLLVLGVINLSSRPLVTSGGRDAAALAIAMAGLIVVGPMELFLIEEAAVSYGGWVWGMMLAAYALLVILIVLLMRPRIVVYNITLDQLRPVLADAVARLDNDARWAGESLVMPQLGVQLHLETAPMLKNVQLVASGPQQSIYGWRQLETALAATLRRTRTAPNPVGASLLIFGVLIAAAISYILARDPSGVMQALNEMLRR